MKEINYLKKNGKISLVAPSLGCSETPRKERLLASIEWFKRNGFEVDEGKNIFINRGIIRSNTPKKCAEEFMNAYESDSDCIISVGGGETMCEILPFIDFEHLKTLPHKFFMGFSDNTNLTFTLATLSQIPTIYGPSAVSFYESDYEGRSPNKDALKLLLGESKKVRGYPRWIKPDGTHSDEVFPKIKFNAKKELIVISKDNEFSMTGRLLGGCLDVLQNLIGTKFDRVKEYLEQYKNDRFIWFLEACDLNPAGIERALFQMKNAGWFKYCKGIIFGRPLHFDEVMFNSDRIIAVKTAIKDLKIPYVLDADLGHNYPSMPIICGVVAKVFVKNGNIYFDYK